MDTYYSDLPQRTTRHRILLWGGALVLALVVLASVGVALIKTSEPIGWSGTGGTGAGPASVEFTRVQAVTGSGGKDVYFISREKTGYFVANFDLTNMSRWPVRVDGLKTEPDWPWPIRLIETAPGIVTPTALQPFWLQPGEQRFIGVQLTIPRGTTCGRGAGTLTWDTIDLRFHYLRFINDAARIELPFGLALQCGDELTPAYDPRG